MVGLLALLLALAGWSAGRVGNLPATASPALPVSSKHFGQLPLSFVPNTGQAAPQVRFQASGLGGSLFFTANEIVLALPRLERSGRAPKLDQRPNAAQQQATERAPIVARLRFEDPNPAPRILGGQILPGKVNYFQGNDPAHWRTNVATYAGITYAALYPGVDLHYDGADGRLKGTYTVAPGADPNRIHWRYNGAAGVQIDSTTGDLRIELAEADAPLLERAPVAWQQIEQQRVPVTVRYVIGRDGALGFALGRYDPTRVLTIDPTLEYSTFLGGEASDSSRSIAVDRDGSIYLTGRTESSQFPTANAFQPALNIADCGLRITLYPCVDAFILKLNAAGTAVLYSTYIGGGNEDATTSIAVDSAGNAYVTGFTRSTDFPIAHARQATFGGSGACPEDNYNQGNPPLCPDAFVVKLSANGSQLDYSTYLGGSGNDAGYSLAVNDHGVATLTGRTSSANFPTANAFQASYTDAGCHPISAPGRRCFDAFVTRLSASGDSLIYSTYLGSWMEDEGHSIAVNRAGEAFVTGKTHSDRFPTVHAFQPAPGAGCASDAISLCFDAFVTKFSADGRTLVYSSFLGGTDYDSSNAIAIDSSDNAYVTGETWSTGFPRVDPLQSACANEYLCRTAFVSKIKHDGSALLYSTFLSGNQAEYGYGIAVDQEGNAYVSGMTYSSTFPTVNAIQAHQGGTIGSPDAFLAKLNSRGNGLLMSTYLGGWSTEYGYGVALRGAQDVLVTGVTCSSDFPIAGALQPTLAGGCDGFLSHISIPSTALTNKLLDDLIGQPIAGASGTVTLYNTAGFLTSAPFTTDATGTFSVTFSGPISQSVKLEYSGLAGYYKQYHDYGATLDQAAGVLLRSGSNTLTTHLVPATVLENTLVDDRTGLPISLKPGTVMVFSGTTILEQAPFTTDAQGVAKITFSTQISRSVQLGYLVDGYFNQYYDRVFTLAQATPIQLRSGASSLTTRLIPATRLVNTLLDDATGLPIGHSSGVVNVYSGTVLLESQGLTTDSSGVFTTTFQHLIDQNVALEYQVGSYARQFYDRKSLLGQATLVAMHGGSNTLATRLAARATLINTLLDDATGQPIANKNGVLTISLAGAPLETQYFTTDASGVYTTTFNRLVDQPAWLEYGQIKGYARQFHNRALNSGQANPIALHAGNNTLTTRLLAAPTLVNTLLDDSTGLPIQNAGGLLQVFVGTQYLEGVPFITNASGVYSATLTNTPVGARATLAYSPMQGYGYQYYDRKARLSQADGVVIDAGQTQLTTRLIPATTLINTLLNGATGRPIRNTSGSVEVISGTTRLDLRSFTTDASGVYTATLSGIVNQDVKLSYYVNGYPQQYYDGRLLLDEADSVRLASGTNRLTTHLLATTLSNTLVNDATGLPIRTTSGAIEVYSGTMLLERQQFQTDSSGVYTTTFATLLDQQVLLKYQVAGYPTQFADRKLALAQADPIHLANGLNRLTTRLLATVLINTLLDDRTGQSIGNMAGSVDVYSGTMLLEQQPFRTDASGVYTTTFQHLISQDVRLSYRVASYAQQFYDRARTLDRATGVRLASGITRLTSRLLPPTVLVDRLRDANSGQPILDAAGILTLYDGVAEIERAQFRTDSTGSFTTTFTSLISESVRIGYRVEGYPQQYADRQPALAQANAVTLHSGTNALDTQLLPMPSVAVTLIDDPTGQPIPNISGWSTFHWSNGQESIPFITDASGVFTTTFRADRDSTLPISQGVTLEYSYIPGYIDQYYDRVYTSVEAKPVFFQSGLNRLATRITRRPTTLLATLMDGPYPITSKPVHLSIERATGVLFEHDYITDFNGNILIEAGWLVGDDFRLRFHVEGFPDQYFGGTTRFDHAGLVTLYAMENYRTFQIARYPTLFNTLLDDSTSAPLTNIVGQLRVYTDTNSFMTFPFDTDDNGVMILQTEGMDVLDDNVRLEYLVDGYTAQFYDRKASYAEADPVLLQNGTTTFTTRLSSAIVPTPPPATPTPPPPTPTPPPMMPGQIGPETGGWLRYNDTTTLTVSFPPGAVTEPISVTIGSQPAAQIVPGTRPVGPAFNIQAHNAAGTPVGHFEQPLTIEIQFDARDIDGIDEGSLYIAYWDTAAGAWLALPSQHDAPAHTISAAVDHLSQFAVFGQPRWKLYLPLAQR